MKNTLLLHVTGTVHFSHSPCPPAFFIVTRFFSMSRSVLTSESAVLRSVCKGREPACQQPEEETRLSGMPNSPATIFSAQHPLSSCTTKFWAPAGAPAQPSCFLRFPECTEAEERAQSRRLPNGYAHPFSSSQVSWAAAGARKPPGELPSSSPRVFVAFRWRARSLLRPRSLPSRLAGKAQ